MAQIEMLITGPGPEMVEHTHGTCFHASRMTSIDVHPALLSIDTRGGAAVHIHASSGIKNDNPCNCDTPLCMGASCTWWSVYERIYLEVVF